MEMRPIIALLYDFDKTLCTTDMQNYSFIPELGMNPEDFWKEVNGFAVENNMDGILAYQYMMLRKSAEKRRPVLRSEFVKLGKDIDFFPGVGEWFDRINAYAESKGALCEHYIISSGLKEVIEGTVIGDKFKQIYASEYFYDENGVAAWPKTAVNYTAKTQYLFRINKGVLDINDNESLNRVTPAKERRVPFRHMIYLGDGLTDVPCMRLVRDNKGHSIAVYPPDADEKLRATSNRLILDQRVDFATEADYREGEELDQLIQRIIDKILTDYSLFAVHKAQRDAAYEMVY